MIWQYCDMASGPSECTAHTQAQHSAACLGECMCGGHTLSGPGLLSAVQLWTVPDFMLFDYLLPLISEHLLVGLVLLVLVLGIAQTLCGLHQYRLSITDCLYTGQTVLVFVWTNLGAEI